MKFKDWIVKEMMTSTSCIAMFVRPMMAPVEREWPPLINEDDPEDKKKKKRKKSK
jgi:hypothetical protein